MAGRPRKVPDGDVEIEITRDGVWTDIRHAKGERVTIPADLAETIIANGHAKRV
jgi:hypothetical protein